ncbi:glyoxalase/bleomycin resistance protein/dioxygenase superfamily protein [Roseibium hamelinense]|uniref:Glyoxalase/bleomycin resistance protein/dioxygenase superfamily protein n=1 Tax=Roseibium hamelinense TaxID=150831 RepID=A0A562T9P9_9HYPH|nr:VOC family protein [Roseibium hamelinense]MTI45331.1 glyoxalase [Roseibium hamelinense]TWI90302.1 glyoxalase/bleomycin resistance protein/dioxygenase superfamily protein [Roseibium hamelinense]
MLKLDHVNLRTANLGAMVTWYEEVVGLKAGPRPPFSFPGAWLYAGNQPVVHLVEVETPAKGEEPRIEHFALSSIGLEAFLKHLKSKNVPYRLGQIPGMQITQVNIFDPDENHIHVDFHGEAQP